MAEAFPSKAEQRVAALEYELRKYRIMFEGDEQVQEIVRKARAWKEACVPTVVEHEGEKHWVLTLNKYQRDNLLWLLTVVGYPAEGWEGHGAVVPFTFANTGDWVGELANMLMEDGRVAALGPEDNPNMSIEELRESVREWLERVK